jgi:hypothetical protein
MSEYLYLLLLVCIEKTSNSSFERVTFRCNAYPSLGSIDSKEVMSICYHNTELIEDLNVMETVPRDG